MTSLVVIVRDELSNGQPQRVVAEQIVKRFLPPKRRSGATCTTRDQCGRGCALSRAVM
jgi:hypothetical protein